MLTVNELMKIKSIDELMEKLDLDDDDDGELKGGSLTIASAVATGAKVLSFLKWAHMKYKDSQKYKEENHSFLLVDGIPVIASYAGPGTRIMQRLKDNDKPKSVVDLISKIHDIEYTLSQTAMTKEEMRKKIRKADEGMIKKLESAKKYKLDNFVNIGIGNLIALKVKLEDKNIVAVSNKLRSIAGDLEKYSPSQIKLLKDSLKSSLIEFNSLVKSAKMKGGVLEEPKEDKMKGTKDCKCGCDKSKIRRRTSTFHPGFSNPPLE